MYTYTYIYKRNIGSLTRAWLIAWPGLAMPGQARPFQAWSGLVRPGQARPVCICLLYKGEPGLGALWADSFVHGASAFS